MCYSITHRHLSVHSSLSPAFNAPPSITVELYNYGSFNAYVITCRTKNYFLPQNFSTSSIVESENFFKAAFYIFTKGHPSIITMTLNLDTWRWWKVLLHWYFTQREYQGLHVVNSLFCSSEEHHHSLHSVQVYPHIPYTCSLYVTMILVCLLDV